MYRSNKKVASIYIYIYIYSICIALVFFWSIRKTSERLLHLLREISSYQVELDSKVVQANREDTAKEKENTRIHSI